jgi:hypothetical protein
MTDQQSTLDPPEADQITIADQAPVGRSKLDAIDGRAIGPTTIGKLDLSILAPEKRGVKIGDARIIDDHLVGYVASDANRLGSLDQQGLVTQATPHLDEDDLCLRR